MKRHPPAAVRHPWWLVLALVLAGALPVRAQIPDSVRMVDGGRRMADSASRLKPISAFWRSLLIPGWGQAATKRWVTGAAFVTWEGTCIMMTAKAQGELNYLRDIGSGHIKGKRQEKEDWLVLLVFNHLFAGAEAFVAGHLQDFPGDLHLRAVPRGVEISLPVPRL